jgi:hypothetical protein
VREASPEASHHESCQWWEATHGRHASRASRSQAIPASGWMRTQESITQNVPERKSPCPRPRGSRTEEEVGWGRVFPRALEAPEHDPGFHPCAHGSQRHRPGQTWTRSCVVADVFSPVLPHRRSSHAREKLAAQLRLTPLPSCWSRGKRRETSTTRRHTTPMASVAGWPGRVARETVTTPARV